MIVVETVLVGGSQTTEVRVEVAVEVDTHTLDRLIVPMTVLTPQSVLKKTGNITKLKIPVSVKRFMKKKLFCS